MATQGITAVITAVMAQVTMDGAGAGSLPFTGVGGASWLIWSRETSEGLLNDGHGCSSGSSVAVMIKKPVPKKIFLTQIGGTLPGS
jgi:hypothetical protein